MPDEKEILETLEDVSRICEGSLPVSCRDDLMKIIEAPLLEACQILYDKNIQTLMSSANPQGGYYIDFDFDSLSETNRKILSHEFGGKEFVMHGGATKYIQVSMSNTPELTSEVIMWGNNIAHALEAQALTWGGHTVDDLEAMLGSNDAYDEKDKIEYWKEYGYFYNPKTKLFFPTEELYKKSL